MNILLYSQSSEDGSTTAYSTFTSKERTSSVKPWGIGTLIDCCGHAGPKSTAEEAPLYGASGCGSWNRKFPTLKADDRR